MVFADQYAYSFKFVENSSIHSAAPLKSLLHQPLSNLPQDGTLLGHLTQRTSLIHAIYAIEVSEITEAFKDFVYDLFCYFLY